MSSRRIDRPGAALLETFLGADRRGRPGPARTRALAAARSDAVAAPWHLLDAVYASLVMGESRAATRLLDKLQAAAPAEDIWTRRVIACRAWAFTLDRNWYPGDVGAEVNEIPQNMPPFPVPAAGDDETTMLEACVALGPVRTLSARSMLFPFGRTRAMVEALPAFLATLADFGKLSDKLHAPSAVTWSHLAAADLVWRTGDSLGARQLLEIARSNALPDPVALANCHLLDGDWWLTPGSTPEVLGFSLWPDKGLPRTDRDGRRRAARCYRIAGSLLARADAPRASGALALRLSVLAWYAGHHQRQAKLLERAERHFSAAGDNAAIWLTLVHRLLADIARGHVAQTQLRAASGWSLAPRGPILRLVKWGRERGSMSYCVGLGRMLQEAGQGWDARGLYEEALTAFAVGVPLIGMTSAKVTAALLADLAQVDSRRRLGLRATTRLHQALWTLPHASHAVDNRMAWLREMLGTTSLLRAHLAAAGTALGVSLGGLALAIERLEQLIDLPGTPSEADCAGVSLSDEQLNGIAQARANDTLDRLMDDADLPITDNERKMLLLATAGARSVLHTAKTLFEYHLGLQAANLGATAAAERWWQVALARAESNIRKDDAWLIPLILAGSGKAEAAQARQSELSKQGLLAETDEAELAIATRDFRRARTLYKERDRGRSIKGLDWLQLTNRAVAELEAGESSRALELIRQAVVKVEGQVLNLRRDPERVAFYDDVNVARLYLVGARAAVGAGPRRLAVRDSRDARDRFATAFAFAERARSLVLATLFDQLNVRSNQATLVRRWQQTATEWQAAYDRLHSAYVEEAAENELKQRLAELDDAESAVNGVEAQVEIDAPTLITRRRVPPLPDLISTQAALPPGAAVLEYQIEGRDLMVWSFTAESAIWGHLRVEPGTLASLVRQVRDACATGVSETDAAAKLANILIKPVQPMVESAGRLVIVPYGPLHALPFGVLPLDGQPLGFSHAISYLPAASLIAGRQLDAKIRPRGILVVGDPAFSKRAHPELRRLPGAAVEAKAIGKIWQTDQVLIDREADHGRVRAGIRDQSIVHIAAHGVLDPVAPSASAIILAGRHDLSVADWIGTRSKLELAVLSACDSGRGSRTLGGDVVGLTRGMVAAGVRRSIVSLWPVHDIVACCLMASFHQKLVATRLPAHALFDAQNDIRGASADDMLARYRALDGEPEMSRNRGLRRYTPVRRVRSRAVALDPDFIDDWSPLDLTPSLNGALPQNWAPFILVGA